MTIGLLGQKEPRSRSALAERLTAPNRAEETHNLSLIQMLPHKMRRQKLQPTKYILNSQI